MTSLKNVWIAMVVVTIIAVGGYFYPRLASVFGGLNTTGPQHYQAESFLQGLAAGVRNQFSVSNTGILSSGGSVLATTSQGTVILTADNVISNGTIAYTCAVTPCVVTLPTQAALAAASQYFIPNAGDRTTRYIVNATTTEATKTSVIGAVGMILQVASTTNTANPTSGVSSMVGGGTLRLTFGRSATSSDIYVTVEAFK